MTINVFSLFFSAVYNVLFYKKMLNATKLPLVRTVLLFVLGIPLGVYIHYASTSMSLGFVVIALVQLSLVIYWLSYFGLSVKDSIVFLAVSAILIKPLLSILSLLAITVFEWSFNFKIEQHIKEGIVLSLVLIVVLILTTNFYDFSRITRFFLGLKSNVKTIFSVTYMLLIILATLPEYVFDTVPDAVIYIFLGALVLFALILLKTDKKNEFAKENLKRQEQYIRDLNNLSETYRKTYNDNRERLYEGESIQHSISVIDSHKNVLQHLMKTKHKTVSAFIYSQFLRAQEKSIQFTCYVETELTTIPFTDFYVIEMFGIILNNAMESTQLTSDPMIDVAITNEVDENAAFTRIAVSNRCEPLAPEMIHNMFKRKYSTKKSADFQRGNGLMKLKKIVRDKGEIITDYNEREQVFTITIELAINQ